MSTSTDKTATETRVVAPDRSLAEAMAPEEIAALAATEREVDARGHRCPMPLLMAKRGLNALNPGQSLLVRSTDAGSLRDFEVFSRQSGHELLVARDRGDDYLFVLRKA